MTNTIENVLGHHYPALVGKTGDTLTDDARALGVIWACLGCGSVGGTDPAHGEAARVRTRDHINFDVWECCPDADTIVF